MGSVVGVNSYIGLQAGASTTSALTTPTLCITNANNVGIGTANPGAVLHIYDSTSSSSSAPLMLFSPNLSVGGAQYMYFGTANSTNNSAQLGWVNVGAGSASNYAFLQIYGRGNIMTWQASTGNVGIGTTNPSCSLAIFNSRAYTGTADSNNLLATTLSLTRTVSGSSQNLVQGQYISRIIFSGSDYSWTPQKVGADISAIASNVDYSGLCADIIFGTLTNTTDANPTEKLRITKNGNVGIGTTNPSTALHVNGTSKLGGIGTPFKSVVAFIATLGAGGAGIVQFTVTYPSAYTDASKLVINVTTAHDPAAAYDDTFGCTIRSVSTTSFILNLKRVDVASAWGANIRAHVVVYELT